MKMRIKRGRGKLSHIVKIFPFEFLGFAITIILIISFCKYLFFLLDKLPVEIIPYFIIE
jgi:hypothetical protein